MFIAAMRAASMRAAVRALVMVVLAASMPAAAFRQSSIGNFQPQSLLNGFGIIVCRSVGHAALLLRFRFFIYHRPRPVLLELLGGLYELRLLSPPQLRELRLRLR